MVNGSEWQNIALYIQRTQPFRNSFSFSKFTKINLDSTIEPAFLVTSSRESYNLIRTHSLSDLASKVWRILCVFPWLCLYSTCTRETLCECVRVNGDSFFRLLRVRVSSQPPCWNTCNCRAVKVQWVCDLRLRNSTNNKVHHPELMPRENEFSEIVHRLKWP